MKSKDNINIINGEEVRFGIRMNLISYSEFIQLLNKKAIENGKKVIKVEREYMSSQICSKCKRINTYMRDYSIRTFKCQSCGFEISRDINAAINIKKRALTALYKENIK